MLFSSILRLFLGVTFLFFSPCFSVTVSNLSGADSEITFMWGDVKSPTCMVSASRSITDLEAFGSDQGLEPPDYIAIEVKFLSQKGLTLRFDDIEKDAEIKLSLHPSDIGNSATSEKESWSAWLTYAASKGIFSLGLLGTSFFGSGIGGAEGAKWGGHLGIQIAQKIAVKLHPVIRYFVNPYLMYGASGLGATSGYALGAVAGAICLPIVFVAGWQAASFLISYAFGKDDTFAVHVYEELEEGFVLLESSKDASIEEKTDLDVLDSEKGWHWVN